MNIKKNSDSWLVLQYQSGDHTALPMLVKRWHKKFCNKAYWLTKDADASKDIAQESWKTIIDKINELRDCNSFGSWALRIVYTKSIDWLRLVNRTYGTFDTYHKTQIQVEERSDDELLKKALLNAVNELPKQQQTVIKLFYVQAYSLKEISNILEISIGTAKSRLFHAREKLKQTLKYINYEN